MNATAVVVAAHGSDADDGVNADVRAVVKQVAATGRFGEVAAAFHRGLPHYSTVLDELRSTRVMVVPYMTSGGYYCDEVLPRELARNKRISQLSLRITPPIGSDPAMVVIAAARAKALARDFGLCLADTSLLVIGHGTRRHAGSRGATLDLANALQDRLGVLQSQGCFLDDDPTIEDALQHVSGTAVVAIVFLLTDGPHARIDVPARLSLKPAPGDRPPYTGCVGRRRVVCDAPIGSDPAVSRLVIHVAMQASRLEGVA